MKKFAGVFWSNRYRRTVYLSALGLVCVIFAGAAVLRYVLAGLPSISQLEEYTPPLITQVYDMNEKPVATFQTQYRTLLSLNEIPVDLQNAVLAMEDDQFFRHWGISPKGIMRAVLRDVLHRRAAQGGSTITQQLAKQILLTPEKKVVRKVRELILALQIERRFSKHEILQMYLNQIFFGEGAYGVLAAARIYFGKDVAELTLAENALLAGLIPAPNRFSPFSQPERARWRRSLVLERMRQEGFITAQDKEKAEAEPLPAARRSYGASRAPYFTEYVRQYLEPKYGVNMFWRGGLRIHTTLDTDAQTAAAVIMEKSLRAMDEEVEKELSEKAAKQTDYEIGEATKTLHLQGAFLILDMKTGAIRAMVGGRNYGENQFNRVTQAMRQPGSTFKPFVWATAIAKGYTPASIVDDIPTAYYFDGRDWRLFEGATDQYSIDLATQPFAGNKDFKIWVPSDFDGKTLGQITLRRGLELSRNLVSINLVDRLGPTVVVETARRAGIRRHLDAVPSLGLGTAVVPLMEMVNAISTFGNGGIKTEPYAITRVEDSNGKVLEEHSPSETEAFPPQQAFLITNMMRGVVERGTGVAAKKLNRPLAGKTGTSQDHRDMWFIGMTPDIAAGAWMGYDDFSTLESKDWTGGSTVVPWWTEIMEEILKDQPARQFPVPDGISFVLIDPDSGKLALPTCKKKFLEAFIKGTEPKVFCDTDHSKTR